MDKITAKQDDTDEEIKLSVKVDEGQPKVVHAMGEIDFYTKERLMTVIDGIFAQNDYEIILDLSGISFMDSSGLSLLVLVQRLVQSHNGHLKCILSGQIIKVLRLTGLQKLFDIHETVESALQDVH